MSLDSYHTTSEWLEQLESDLLFLIRDSGPSAERVHFEKAHTAILDLINYRKKRDNQNDRTS